VSTVAFLGPQNAAKLRLGLRHRPHWGSLQRSPDLLAGFKKPTFKATTSKGRQWEGKRSRGFARNPRAASGNAWKYTNLQPYLYSSLFTKTAGNHIGKHYNVGRGRVPASSTRRWCKVSYWNVNTMAQPYGDWRVQKLKAESVRRSAALSGRKKDLIDRYVVFGINRM